MAVDRGGRADKLGNRYEGLWVARNLLRVLAGEAVAVTIEAVGDEEEGVDQWVDFLDRRREAQQCKRKNRNYGKWTLGELRSRDVLSRLKSQLQRHPAHLFTFVSVHDAPEFSKLCTLARTTGNDCTAFWKTATSTKESGAALVSFCEAVGVDPTDPAQRPVAYDLLQRSDVRVFDDSQSGRQDVELLARLSVNGDPRTVVTLLANFAHEQMGNPLHADEIRAYLRSQGVPPRDLAGEPLLAPRIELLQKEFEASLRPALIAGTMIPRSEVERVRDALRPGGPRLAVVHGRAGSGKSSVLLGLTDLLARENFPFLPLRLDRRTPQDTARQYGTALCGLPDSPALSLRALAGTRSAVLILDQLDAIRWSAAHGRASWEACREVIDEALTFPQLSVVLSCRTFDLRDDQLIRAWLKRQHGVEIEIGELPDADVERVVNREGGRYHSLNAAQRLLLRSPLYLSLWVQLAQGGTAPTAFSTPSELMRDFWRMRREQLQRMGVTGAETEAALGELVVRMDRTGIPQAPQRVLDRYPNARNALQSLSVVVMSDGHVNFAHQAFFEHLFATRLLDEIAAGRQSVLDWLRGHEQSLFRRDQLRQLLLLQRDEAPADYLATVSGILSDPGIRFHLKHLVLRLLGDVARPTDQEVEYVLGLLRQPAWKDHILETVLGGKASWFDALVRQGFLSATLASGVEAEQFLGLGLIRAVVDSCGDQVASILAPYEGAPDPWPRWIARLLRTDGSTDTRVLYELRLRTIARGSADDPPRLPSGLIGTHPVWCIEWIETRLQREVSCRTGQTLKEDSLDEEETFDLNIHEADTLCRLAAGAPREMWARLVPLILRLSELTRRESRRLAPGEFVPDTFWAQPQGRRRLLEPPDLIAAVALAGAIQAVEDPGFLEREIGALAGHCSRTVQQLLAHLLLLSSESRADRAINWLCDCPARLFLGGRGPRRWWYAQELIRQFAETCSAATYARLESVLLECHDPLEFRNLLDERAAVDEAFPPRTDWFGLAQHALLPALPEGRMSRQAAAARAQWREKFELEAERFIRGRVGGHQSFVLPLSPERARNLTYEQWVDLIRAHPQTLGMGHHCNVDDHHFTVRDAAHYAQVLALLARSQQRRCADLALRIPPDANPQYLLAILRALWDREAEDPRKPGDWDPATPEQVARLAEAVSYTEERDLALAWCQMVRQWSEVRWPDPVLATLRRYATEHSDPRTDACPGTGEDSTDLEASRLNCVRGAAAEAIEAILFDQPALYEYFLPTIERIVVDPSPIVRIAAAGVCRPVLNCDRARALDLFLQACDSEDAVLACRAVTDFLAYTLAGNQQRLEPLVERMVRSTHSDAARIGAQWVTLSWLHGCMTEESLLECSQSAHAAHRLGVAEIAAESVADEKLAASAATLLPRAFEDEDTNVRRAAMMFLREDGTLDYAPVRDLLPCCVRSKAFLEDPTALLEALSSYDGSLVPLAEVTFAICDLFCGPLAEASRDMRQGAAYDVSLVPPLLLRLYEQAEHGGHRDLQARCLDAWDRLLQARVGSVRDLLLSLDR